MKMGHPPEDAVGGEDDRGQGLILLDVPTDSVTLGRSYALASTVQEGEFKQISPDESFCGSKEAETSTHRTLQFIYPLNGPSPIRNMRYTRHNQDEHKDDRFGHFEGSVVTRQCVVTDSHQLAVG